MKKLFLMLTMLFITTITVAYSSEPGEYIPVTPDANLLDRFYNLDNIDNLSISFMKFYKDYDKALSYFKEELAKAPFKSGAEDAGCLSGSFEKSPILKEYISKYNICSITMRGSIDSNKYFNSTVLYIVDPDTQDVSYWMYIN